MGGSLSLIRSATGRKGASRERTPQRADEWKDEGGRGEGGGERGRAAGNWFQTDPEIRFCQSQLLHD